MEPLQRVRLVDDPDALRAGVYLLATAIFTTALAESKGQLSHWVEANEDEKYAIQCKAKQFVLEWREYFKRRARVQKGNKFYVPQSDSYRNRRKRT